MTEFHLHTLMSKGLQDFIKAWPLSIHNLREPTKNKIEIFSIMTLNNKEYIDQSMYLHPALHALSYVLSSEPQTGLYISWHKQGHLPSWATWTPLRWKLCWLIELISNKLGTVYYCGYILFLYKIDLSKGLILFKIVKEAGWSIN